MNHRWLTASEVGKKIGRAARQVRERYALLDGFPPAYRPGGHGHPVWREDEIEEWMERWRPSPTEQRHRSSTAGNRSAAES